MTYTELTQHIQATKSYLCIGLDTAAEQLPHHLAQDTKGMLAFNKAIINATSEFCVSYKLNTAFYEAQGAKGWEVMHETLALIPPNKFVIADAKRGDIGNTVNQYAKAFFEQMNFHAITVAPYMGADSVMPFLAYKDKWVILLALTSNESAKNFQLLDLKKEMPLYQEVLQQSASWATYEQMMYVVGATKTAHLAEIRQLMPNHFLLVPGIGVQGGSLQEVSKYAMNQDVGLLINASRSIIYASAKEDFAEKARLEAQKIQLEMKELLAQFPFKNSKE